MMMLLALGAALLLDPSDEAFLRAQAQRVVASAHLAPGAVSGQWRNSTPYDLHVPGGNMGYPAFWVRDAVMMLGADLIPAAEVEGWIRLMASTLREKDWPVRPGVVVPAYAVPDHINFDGRPTFYPGNYETGEKQGGKLFGKYPPLDDHFYFISAVHEHWRLTRNLTLFRSRVGALCEKVYAVAPQDAATGLVTAGDTETENAKDGGFCDAEFKSGKLLFPSVLKLVAARQLAELFDAAGDRAKARHYRADAARLRRHIGRTFLDADGWLRSATGVGNQPDVWGSAFAVWADAVEPPATHRISRSLVRAYRDRTAVREGCVRHILTTDQTNHGAWQKSLAAPGTYQNGGYWGTPSGWYIAAIHRVDPQAARDMAREYVHFLRTSEAWEWFNPDTGKHSNPLYVATVALPYISLVRAGLLRAQ
jgi:hypothetical protein